MFDRIRKAIAGDNRAPAAAAANHARTGVQAPVSEWAATQGFEFSLPGGSQNFAVQGKVGTRKWRMEVGRPSREYISGEELRARADLGTDENVAVMVMSRPLKEQLEKKAYAIYTDELQTIADASLPEEMRWLSMYEEVGWEGPPQPFWDRYCVLADRRESALKWIDPALARRLAAWPEPALPHDVPFVLMLMRGKAYLRMQYVPDDMAVLQHATAIYINACEGAMDCFPVEK